MRNGADAFTIVKALGGRWYGGYGTARCPAHSDRQPSLSISRHNGILLFHCHAGCEQAAVLSALRREGLWASHQNEPLAHRRVDARTADAAHRTESAKRIWAEGCDAKGTAVETYLKHRGIELPPAGDDVIRFHPRLAHPVGGTWPAMLAAISDARSGEFCAVHRTYLDHAGEKAPVEPVRAILGPKRGGVIRLIADTAIEQRLAYAEGVETALTVIKGGWACWAAIDAGNLAKLPVWPWIDLTIFADHDPAGLKAARVLADRWLAAGGAVTFCVAPRAGRDWNDELRGSGL